jgi:hypothetical protein
MDAARRFEREQLPATAIRARFLEIRAERFLLVGRRMSAGARSIRRAGLETTLLLVCSA